MMLVLMAPIRACAQGGGEGFASELRTLTTARQAGSGGVALEDPWRQGSYADVTSVALSSGLRWFGLGIQGGGGSGFRVGSDGFVFSSPAMTRTLDQPDGSYGGEGGTFRPVEWGARVTGQWTLRDSRSWRFAVLGRIIGMNQHLADVNRIGVGGAVGAQAQRVLDAGRMLTLWGMAGPLGWGAGHLFAGDITAGAALLANRSQGFLGGAEGYALGAEGEWQTENVMDGGAGLSYWFGRPTGSGSTFFVRLGVRYQQGNVAAVQPRGGLGFLWRSAEQWGFQFDYAIAPLGELGWLHYATLGIRFSPTRR